VHSRELAQQLIRACDGHEDVDRQQVVVDGRDLGGVARPDDAGGGDGCAGGGRAGSGQGAAMSRVLGLPPHGGGAVWPGEAGVGDGSQQAGMQLANPMPHSPAACHIQLRAACSREEWGGGLEVHEVAHPHPHPPGPPTPTPT